MSHPSHPELPADSTPALLARRLNWLRAGVSGAGDGIVSVAGLVIGMAGAGASHAVVLTAGIAGLFAGALSMAAAEYVSVSSQRDAQRAILDREQWELTHLPAAALDELTRLYEAKGVSPEVARRVAEELTAQDALLAHADVEHGIDPKLLTNPWHAAAASSAAFVAGAVLPVAAISIPPNDVRVAVCFLAVLVALALTGSISARLGGAKLRPASVRTVLGGALTMAATFTIGALLGTSL